MDQQSVARREFMESTAKTAAGVALGGTLARTASARVLGANDRIRIGIIGSGGRGGWGMSECIQAGAEIVAICDVQQAHRERAKARAEVMMDEKDTPHGDIALYVDHRELLERNDIDGVFIGVPDHWHHDVLIDSVNAGKDAYCEKPFSKSIELGKNMVRAVRATDRIVQVGNHRRSGEHWKRAAEVVKSGRIGKVTWVRVFDTRDWSRGDPFLNRKIEGEVDWERFQGDAPKVPLDTKRLFAWRWYWDYAGGLTTDIGAHQLDIVQWVMDVIGPKSAIGNGGNYYSKFDFWETPDTVNNVLDYGTFLANFNVQFVSGRDGVGGTFYGSEGTLVFDSTFRLYDRVDNPDTPDVNEYSQPQEQWERPYEGPAHVQNWLSCMRSRKEPNSPVEVGHRVITAAHLCNMSYKYGTRMDWDVEKEQLV